VLYSPWRGPPRGWLQSCPPAPCRRTGTTESAWGARSQLCDGVLVLGEKQSRLTAIVACGGILRAQRWHSALVGVRVQARCGHLQPVGTVCAGADASVSGICAGSTASV